jgi:hypothetical protein
MEKVVHGGSHAVHGRSGLPWVVASSISLFGMTAGSARANLIINPVYDSTVTTLANYPQVQSAFAYAAAQFENVFTNNITLNITVAATSDPTVLSMSSDDFIGAYNYFRIKSLLTGHETSAADVSAVASLGNVDPTNGGKFWLTQPQAKALGQPIIDLTSDGTFTFGTGYSFTFDPANRAVSGKFDFIGLAEHEISEIMGRNKGLATYDLAGNPAYVPNDLFRFKSAGTRSVVASDTGVYFSVDNGTTGLENFNSVLPGDVSDWATGGSADAFNAVFVAGVEQDMSPNDFTAIDVIGFDVPEPGSTTLLGAAMAAGLLWDGRTRRRREKFFLR